MNTFFISYLSGICDFPITTMASHAELPVGCPLCHNCYNEPRLLQCGHAYCTDCLLDHIHTNVNNGQFSCHVCQAVHQAPDQPGLSRQFRAMFPIQPEFILATARPPTQTASLSGSRSQQPSFYSEKRAEIQAMSDKVQQLEKYITSYCQEGEKTLHKCAADVKLMRERVKAHTEKEVQKLRGQEQALLDDISQIENEVKMAAQELESRTQAVQDAMLEIIGAEEEDVMRGTEALKHVKQWWEEQKTQPISTFSWVCGVNTEQKQSEHKNVGRLLVDRKQTALRLTGTATGSTEADGGVQKDIKLECEALIVGVTTVNNMVLTMHWGDPHIWGYKKSGQYVKKVWVPKLQSPGGYGTNVHLPGEGSYTQMCIIDFGGRTMHLLRLSEDLEMIGQQIVQLGYIPWSLTLSRGGAELVVTEWDSRKVRTYNSCGELLHQYDNPCRPGCAIKLTSGEYVTREYNGYKLMWSNSSGDKLREYDNDDNPIYNPLYLAEDMQGNILVTYCHGAVLVDPRGCYTKNVLEGGSVWYPWCFHLDEGGCLYVADNTYRHIKLKVIQHNKIKKSEEPNVMKTNITAILTLFE